MPPAPAPLIPSPEQTRAANVQAAPYNGGAAPTGQAVLSSSTPARTATADNVTKLQTVTAPPPTDTNLFAKPGEDYKTYESRVSTYQKTNPPANTSTTTDTPPQNPATNPTPPTQTAADSSSEKDPYESAVAGITDPGLQAQYKDYLKSQDQEMQNAQANIDAIKARSLNDPAITGIVNSIKAKYDQQIALMRAKNQQLLGRANTSVAAFGGLGQMSQSFLSDQQSRAEQRIQTIQDQEDAAIAKAQAAYITQNYKDLNDAMAQYDKANADKLKALNELLTSSSKQVSQMQSEQRLALQEKKAALAADVTMSTKIASGIAANLKAANLTDTEQIMSYVKGIAEQYGISNADILYSQVVEAQQKMGKDELAAANTKDQMAVRDAGLKIREKKANAPAKGKSPPKPTLWQSQEQAYTAINQLVKPGVTDKDGVPYMWQAANGEHYLTKEGFKSLITAAKEDKIKRADFLNEYSIYLEPGQGASYGLTPAEITKYGL